MQGFFRVTNGAGYGFGYIVGGVLYKVYHTVMGTGVNFTGACVQVGGFKLPFLSVGNCVVILMIPCALLIRNISKL